MRNLPFRNPTFVLEPGDRNRVVRERFGPLKDEKRGTAKIKQGSELTDINRATLEFEDPKVLELAFKCIEATSDYKIACVKNKLNETNQPPCIHLNVAVKSDQSKYEHDWICEVQMYLRSVLRIKTTSHIFYNVARAQNEFAIKDIQEKPQASASGGFKLNNETLKTGAKEWCEDSGKAEAKYGHISGWDTSEVTSMKWLFRADEYGTGKAGKQFNEDISRWNVGRVEDMQCMFYVAKSFDQDLSAWNVEKCKDMALMFNGADKFNKDSIKNWDLIYITCSIKGETRENPTQRIQKQSPV